MRVVSIITISCLSGLKDITCSMMILMLLSPRNDNDLAIPDKEACRTNKEGQDILTVEIFITPGRWRRIGWEVHLNRTWRRRSVLLGLEK